MRDFAGEFGALSQAYDQLNEELSATWNQSSGDPKALAGCILLSSGCLARIEQMNTRVLRLTQEWKERRPALDARSRQQVDGLAENARRQAIRLHDLCSSQAQKLNDVKAKIERDLAELGKGAQYLKSIKPIKSNYPKFIDSMY
jgi:hypothetical protein